jgi:hypothetical protein
MTNLTIVEIDAIAMVILCKEYDRLDFIPDFKTRIDTAKQNFKERFLQRCNCQSCISATVFIMTLKFYEDDENI